MSSPAFDLDRRMDLLREALGLGADESPFPWQSRLLREFLEPDLCVRALDIPTGLGKTAVMTVWLVARALGAKALPRRLVYVVDRRAVVDQATEVAKSLRAWVDRTPEVKRALELGDRSLPISTLRGQHVDNREWLEDPAAPAIVVGTVDMVGSRLLFEGYGVSRKMRPYHAGLLGADTLVTLDEAHLVPPFERLLDSIADGEAMLGPCDGRGAVVPHFRLLSLSATGRARSTGTFSLDKDDLKHPEVKKRLGARKRLRTMTLEGELAEVLAHRAWDASEKGYEPVRCIVFCHKRDDAVAVWEALGSLAKGDKKVERAKVEIERELFVGARRVFEREQTMNRLRERGFIAGSDFERKRPSFVIATSAGEVGVDLDADHMICDLVAWERMVQRLGRVNRRGDGDAMVTVIVGPQAEPPKKVLEAMKRLEADSNGTSKRKEALRKKDVAVVEKYEAEQAGTAALPKPLRELPKLEGGGYDASPGALRDLKLRALEDTKLARVLDAATTRPPLWPALTRPLLDAWAMTSLQEHTGRAAVAPWLRGWVEEDEPQTSVVWRRWLPVRERPALRKEEAAAFFEAAPPHASEVLETETRRVAEWLLARVAKLAQSSREAEPVPLATAGPEKESDSAAEEVREDERGSARIRPWEPVAFVLDAAGEMERWLTLDELLAIASGEKWQRDRLARELSGDTLVVDRRLAGLSEGMLAEDFEDLPDTSDGEKWMPPIDGEPPAVRFRIRERTEDVDPDAASAWRERLRFVLKTSPEGETLRWLAIEKWRHDAATEEDRSAGRKQLLTEHQDWTERHARELARRLGLSAELTEMLALAARLHDEGKRAARWQRAFSAPEGGPFAKTPGPLRVALLGGYRHEFGSLPIAAEDPVLRSLAPELRDLVLHMIAAHHGFARPLLSTEGCEDAPKSVLEERAREVAQRFVRLQNAWGPWGLAWWEALLRAADQQASRENDDAGKKGAR